MGLIPAHYNIQLIPSSDLCRVGSPKQHKNINQSFRHTQLVGAAAVALRGFIIKRGVKKKNPLPLKESEAVTGRAALN